jgi:P-type E1-E2 ATPase
MSQAFSQSDASLRTGEERDLIGLSQEEARRRFKHLDAIENFTSIEVLCSDKTGTITSGEMQLEASLAPNGSHQNAPCFLAISTAASRPGSRVHSIAQSWPVRSRRRTVT